MAERCFGAFLYGDHPYGRWLDGTKTSVQSITRADAKAFYEHWYRPNNTILTVVGDVQAADALERIRAAFGDWESRPDAVPERAGPPAPVTARRTLLVDQPDASQAQIRVGSIAMARNAPDLLPSQVANTVLGGGFSSRLIEELRVKRSLTYGASSMFIARLTGGDFRITTFSKNATAVETLALALQVQETFRKDPIDAQLLAKARTYLAGQFPLKLETADALAARLTEMEFFGLPKDDLETYVSRVDGGGSGSGAPRCPSATCPPPSRSRSWWSARRRRSSLAWRSASLPCGSSPVRSAKACVPERRYGGQAPGAGASIAT